MWKKLREDYERHGRSLLDPGLWTIATYRYGKWLDGAPGPVRWAGGKIYGGLLLGLQALSGNVLYKEVQCGEELTLPHARNVLIHPEAVLGDRVTVEHHVSIVTNRGREGAPTIGNDVTIEAGAKVLGPIKVGDGATIASNSLVVIDVPPGATAIGVPARIILPKPPESKSTNGKHAAPSASGS
jgi:serine O-acetyltransferase